MVRNSFMTTGFAFAQLVEKIETLLVNELGLRTREIPSDLQHAGGVWKDRDVTIDSHAYYGSKIRYARFVVLQGQELEIGNVLCLPDPNYALPILGADLVALRQETGMVAVDLSPTSPSGHEREVQLDALSSFLGYVPTFPPGGILPSWCAAWFSPYALYTRGDHDQLRQIPDVMATYARAMIELTRSCAHRPDGAQTAMATQEEYLLAHRTDDKGLNLLAKMFGREWTDRYLIEVMFPPIDATGSAQDATRQMSRMEEVQEHEEKGPNPHAKRDLNGSLSRASRQNTRRRLAREKLS